MLGPRRVPFVRALLLLSLSAVCRCTRVGAGPYYAAAAADPADPAGAPAPRALQAVVLSEGDTVVNGVLDLFSAEGVAACEGACVVAFSAAFGVEESAIGCLCPSTTTTGSSLRRTRMLFGRDHNLERAEREASSSGRGLRGLAELDESETVAFSARVSGGLNGGAAAVGLLSGSMGSVAAAFGIQESEVRCTPYIFFV